MNLNVLIFLFISLDIVETLTFNNFAILTKSSHRYLNLLERLYPNIYNELNDVFLELISSNAPPTKKYYEKIEKILKKVPEFKF